VTRVFLFILIITIFYANHVLVTIIILEVRSILFALTFVRLNPIIDNLFIILLSFLIIEGVLSLLILVLLIEHSGEDYSIIRITNF